MRKFVGKSNVAGNLIEKALTEQNMTKEDLCRKLQLLGINIDRVHLYRITKRKVVLKDFELIAICKILKIDLNTLVNLIEI